MNFSAFCTSPRVESTVLKSSSGSSTSRGVLFTENLLLLGNGAVPKRVKFLLAHWSGAEVNLRKPFVVGVGGIFRLFCRDTGNVVARHRRWE